jgi:phenylacetate-coenzyme A ligase PaaK-like adenylate-forming protein
MPEYIQRLDWPADKLRTEREQRLRALVRKAQESSLWHRERLSGFDPDALREEDLESLPTMTKADVMANWDGIVTDPRLSLEMVEAHLEGLTGDAYMLDHFHAVASSGSSGRRGVFVYDWDGWLTHGLGALRYGVRFAARHPQAGPSVVAVVAAELATHVTSALSQTFSNPALAIHRVPVTLPVDKIVAQLNDLQPTALMGYPSMLQLLAARARAGELRIHPKRVLSSAEPLLPEARRAIGDAWGAPVQNGYAASELVIAGSCEAAGCHIVEDLIFFEPVDGFGKAVAADVTSDKVFVTNLYNLALPLIRYELTDEVTVLSEPCACGSSFRRLDDIHGRMDDIFRYAGDITVHPHVFRSPLGRQRAVIAYQVRQTDRGANIDVQLIGDVRVKDLQGEIVGALRKVGLANAEITVTPVDSLHRGATGKLKRFVPLRAESSTH